MKLYLRQQIWATAIAAALGAAPALAADGWQARPDRPAAVPGAEQSRALDKFPAQGVRPRLAAALRAKDVMHRFAALKISLHDIRRGAAKVPPLFMVRFPGDMGALKSAKQRKAVFIQSVLPLILQANREVARERRRMNEILAALAHGQAAGPVQRRFLENLSADYGVDYGDWAELRLRVDEVPVSLALAQGAEESGWGTSRFAQQGNAVFGQRTFRRGRGIVPAQRQAGKKFEVLRFGALLTSVRAYLWNLNTHFAYARFRARRAGAQAAGKRPDSLALVAALNSYSERGAAYIETIRSIIRFNRLRQFDASRLAGPDKSI